MRQECHAAAWEEWRGGSQGMLAACGGAAEVEGRRNSGSNDCIRQGLVTTLVGCKSLGLQGPLPRPRRTRP